MATDKEAKAEHRNQIADEKGLNNQEIPASKNSRQLDISEILGNNRNFFDDDDDIPWNGKTQLIIMPSKSK